ncbi:hypothetical protein COU54_00575 [Candidatus Pacearchaeota archaeon CG10_big_fil_rev_8_21_14_0_10_31_24]|nr:MAG: hypothetical protein COU54_00575 [Candidatus Pacearchaeota archaeon CG10_big_fil_rev_8_21_14_0_10_31_24]
MKTDVRLLPVEKLECSARGMSGYDYKLYNISSAISPYLVAGELREKAGEIEKADENYSEAAKCAIIEGCFSSFDEAMDKLSTQEQQIELAKGLAKMLQNNIRGAYTPGNWDSDRLNNRISSKEYAERTAYALKRAGVSKSPNQVFDEEFKDSIAYIDRMGQVVGFRFR